MIKIVSDGKKLNKELEELEKDYSKGNTSKKEYFAHKRDIEQKMETLRVADHVRRMQGRLGSEKSLDHWSDQEQEKKKLADEAEKEEMIKQYITNPSSIKGKEIPSREWFGERAKLGLMAFVALALLVGTSMGFIFINEPSETASVSMLVNDSAFPPVANNTTTLTTNTTTTADTTNTATNTQTTTTSTPTTTNTQTTPNNNDDNSGDTEPTNQTG
ncbi:hypothetical protein [Methanobacterium petrolearium]|uniref:hypothetical protein n=1 Tax=Methanobacterium petrolearium TaxID=710190 RepID=UPI001AE5D68E|nr:hypothetical protein [Methanobacterium petrolearium]MBP1946791.1 hypothetical protein [Methanobacterium petrolearium]BDZ69761.1 hypothetical protein GCM10025861_02780 [Methanobacterium petrolearium]